VTNQETAEMFDQVVSSALTLGPASRTDLLVAAVTAHAPTPIIQTLLELPDRPYRDLAEVREECLTLP
jgi:hypothetical protein